MPRMFPTMISPAAKNVAQPLAALHQRHSALTRQNNARTETVWFNYPRPVELHDYRFLGEGQQRRRRKKSGNPDLNMRTEAYKLFGADLTQIPGLRMLTFMLFSEVGRDMSRWPTAAHFVSWLGLCPYNDISGGKVQCR